MAVSIKIQTSHSYANLRFFMTFSWIKRSIRIESLPPTVPDDCRYVIARYIHNSNWETHTLKIISYTTHRALLDFAQAHNLDLDAYFYEDLLLSEITVSSVDDFVVELSIRILNYPNLDWKNNLTEVIFWLLMQHQFLQVLKMHQHH